MNGESEEGGILKRMGEVLSGAAWRPHPLDRRYPLRERMGADWILVVVAYERYWELVVVRRDRRGKLEVGVREEVRLEEGCVTPSELPASVEVYGVVRAVLVQVNGWEIERSPGEETGGGTSLENQLGEEGRLYTTELGAIRGWRFSVAERLVREALTFLGRCGLDCIRCVDGLSSMLRRLVEAGETDFQRGDHLVLEAAGEWLVMVRGEGDVWNCLGQGVDGERELECEPGWRRRIPSEAARIIYCGEKTSRSPTQMDGLERLTAPAGGWLLEVAAWDPEPRGLVQSDLRGVGESVRDCLPGGLRWLRPALLLILVSSLGWLWWQYEGSRELREPIQREEMRIVEERARQRELLQEIEREREWEVLADELGEWVSPLMPLGSLSTELLESVPEGLWIRQFQTRSFAGQRQVEIRIELEGDRLVGSTWTSSLWEALGSRGYQLVTLDQSEREGGLTTRALFLIPYRI